MSNVAKIAVGVALGLLLFIVTVVLLSGPPSGWAHHVIKDPMTDAVTASAEVTATDGRGALEISCVDGQPLGLVFETQARMGGYKGEENYVDRMLRYRFDDGSVKDTVAVFGDNWIGFREKDPRWAKPIIEGMASASKLAIDADSVLGDKVQLVFDIRGADKAMRRVQQECRK